MTTARGRKRIGGAAPARAHSNSAVVEHHRASAPQEAHPGGQRYFVQSLARGLDVVRAFGVDGGALTLGEIAHRTGMSRAAARRYILTLRDLDYIRVRGTHFELKARLLELGYSYLASLPLWKIAEPVLTELVDHVHETCSVSVLDIPDIVYVSRVAVKRIISSSVSVGTRLPAFATAMGRVMLADLPPAQLQDYVRTVQLPAITQYTLTNRKKLFAAIQDAGERGYAIVDNEFAIGLHSIAVPVRDRGGATIAALNLSASALHGEAEGLARHLSSLQAAARNLTAGLPY
ncbi:MAG: IclR family transcriptional regulator C-terminal domain-containing protein [Variibacter sp.]